jgi:hypothetical protein
MLGSLGLLRAVPSYSRRVTVTSVRIVVRVMQ